MEILTRTAPRAIERSGPDLLFDQPGTIEFVGGISPGITLRAVLLVAALGGGFTLAYEWLILSAAVTAIGALLLAVVVPFALIGGVPEDGTVTESFSRL